jgi:hypothetical protein
MGIRRIEQMTFTVRITVHDNEGMRSTKEKVVYSVITPLHCITRDASGSCRVIQDIPHAPWRPKSNGETQMSESKKRGQMS